MTTMTVQQIRQVVAMPHHPSEDMLRVFTDAPAGYYDHGRVRVRSSRDGTIVSIDGTPIIEDVHGHLYVVSAYAQSYRREQQEKLRAWRREQHARYLVERQRIVDTLLQGGFVYYRDGQMGGIYAMGNDSMTVSAPSVDKILGADAVCIEITSKYDWRGCGRRAQMSWATAYDELWDPHPKDARSQVKNTLRIP